MNKSKLNNLDTFFIYIELDKLMTQSGNKQTLLNFSQQSILLVFIALMVISVVCFKNISPVLCCCFEDTKLDT